MLLLLIALQLPYTVNGIGLARHRPDLLYFLEEYHGSLEQILHLFIVLIGCRRNGLLGLFYDRRDLADVNTHLLGVFVGHLRTAGLAVICSKK